MSNASIARRLLEMTDRYTSGALPASAIAAGLERHGPALEGVPQEVRDRLHALSVAVIAEDVSPLEAEQLGLANRRDALDALRRMLEQL